MDSLRLRGRLLVYDPTTNVFDLDSYQKLAAESSCITTCVLVISPLLTLYKMTDVVVTTIKSSTLFVLLHQMMPPPMMVVVPIIIPSFSLTLLVNLLRDVSIRKFGSCFEELATGLASKDRSIVQCRFSSQFCWRPPPPPSTVAILIMLISTHPEISSK